MLQSTLTNELSSITRKIHLSVKHECDKLKKLNRQPVIALGEFVGSAFMMTLYVFLMLIGCTVLHFLIRRLFKIKYEYVLLSMVGCIVDGPTASLTAAGGNWKSLINIGLIMGVIAGACGNYVGIICRLCGQSYMWTIGL